MNISDLVNLLLRRDIFLFVAAIITGIFLLKATVFRKKKSSEKRHKRNVKYSKKITQKLIGMQDEPGKVIAFLRKTDPYIVEEVVLNGFQDSGYKIKRGTSYSNDGGIDGTIYQNGKEVYVQTKRYQSHISASHIRDFNAVCSRNNVKGVFVHTGKTGRGAKSDKASHIDIISGQRLIDLITQSNGFKLRV